MAGAIYLFLDGIPGESTAVNFKNWIDVQSFSYGVSMEVDPDARTGSGGGTSGAADPEDISCDKKMDWATPMLLSCCATGAVIPKARLIQNNIVNGIILPVSDYAMDSVMITNVSLSGSGGGIPEESMSFAFGSVMWQYHCYSHSNASDFIDKYHKEWSLISADPLKADSRALDVFSSVPPEGGIDYDSCASGSQTFTTIRGVTAD